MSAFALQIWYERVPQVAVEATCVAQRRETGLRRARAMKSTTRRERFRSDFQRAAPHILP